MFIEAGKLRLALVVFGFSSTGAPFNHRPIFGLELHQPPHALHQHAPNPGIAVFVDRALKTALVRRVFPGTHPSVAGHLAPILKPVPVSFWGQASKINKVRPCLHKHGAGLGSALEL
jgi:hypothetical protein